MSIETILDDPHIESDDSPQGSIWVLVVLHGKLVFCEAQVASSSLPMLRNVGRRHSIFGGLHGDDSVISDHALDDSRVVDLQSECQDVEVVFSNCFID